MKYKCSMKDFLKIVGYITKHLMTAHSGNNFVFPGISMFPLSILLHKTLELSGIAWSSQRTLLLNQRFNLSELNRLLHYTTYCRAHDTPLHCY